LGRTERVMWKANTSKVVAPICVGKGPMSWPSQASSECTDHMLEIWAQQTDIACSSIDAWLMPTTSNIVVGRKSGAGPTGHSTEGRDGVKSTFFSRAVGSVQLY
jgi:hypothetical protein